MYCCSQYLLDICSCVSLSRSLVTFCCPKLASLYELNQRLQKTHALPTLIAPPASISTPRIEIKVEPQLHTLMETNQDEDSVFNDHPAIKPDPDKKPPGPREQDRKRSPNVRIGKETTTPQKGRKLAEGKEEGEEEHRAYFGWCGHHYSLLMHLSTIVQTVTVQCPTAFVHSRFKPPSKNVWVCG